jgi:tRNA-uridine 2-sulfurtransferase
MSINTNKNKKVFVGLSGGVDSSVAALLLKEAGYDVTGVFLRCFNLDGCAEYDAEDARLVAEYLNIPFYTFDLEKEYKEKVVDYMVQGYKEGFTPNPDVVCNREIKFGLFLQKTRSLGADYVATGHYVIKRKIGEKFALFAGEDKNKDQSYFLWQLNQEDLKHSLFPVGEYTKEEVRKIAEKAGLPTAQKKDSQGICFLGKISLKDFLKKYISEKKGDVVSLDGKKIGEHKGVNYYTIGERHVGIDNPKTSTGGKTLPYYVAEKDIKTNTLVMAEGKDNPALFKKEVVLKNVNFIRLVKKEKIKVKARIRYRQPLFDAVFYKLSDNSYKLTFEEPQKSIALGQSAVIYTKDEEMIGGGVIIK